MYFFYPVCSVFLLLYNMFVYLVYFWKQDVKNLYVRDYFDDTFIFTRCSILKILFL